MPENILRIKRSDGNDKFVLLNISSNGPQSLDLRIQATEGEYPYWTDIKASRVSKLREKKSTQTEAEWENTLVTVLLQHRGFLSNLEQQFNEKIEAVANISPSRMTLILRKNISGITQRLGEITLQQDDSLELDTLHWISTAISRGDELEAQVAELTTKHASAQGTISALNRQLEELITGKQAHENALLEKFKVLLNEKKLKIREQQRLLAQSKVRKTPGRFQTSIEKQTGDATTPVSAAFKEKPTEIRSKKRKIDVSLEEKEEEDAFERPASLARVKDEELNSEELNDDGDRMLQTPDASDGEITEDEDGAEDERDERGRDEYKTGDMHGSQRMQVDQPSPSISNLPPDRKLPFEETRPKIRSGAVQKQQPEVPEKDQTTDDDDEL